MLLISKSALAHTIFKIIEEIKADIIPIIKPSTINGDRINALVAPTDFIMLISNLRLYIVILTVFEINIIETAAKAIVIQNPTVLTSFFKPDNFLAISLLSLTESTSPYLL